MVGVGLFCRNDTRRSGRISYNISAQRCQPHLPGRSWASRSGFPTATTSVKKATTIAAADSLAALSNAAAAIGGRTRTATAASLKGRIELTCYY